MFNKSLPRFRLLGSTAAAVIITASCALTTSTQQQSQNAVLPGQLQQQAMPQQETANGFIAPGALQQQAGSSVMGAPPASAVQPVSVGGPPGALGAVTSSAITPTATPSGATEKARFPAWAIVLIVVSAVLLIVGGVMIRWWLSKSDSSARGELDGFIFQDKRRNARARANVQAYYKGRQDPPHSHYARFLKVDDIASSIASTSEAESNADQGASIEPRSSSSSQKEGSVRYSASAPPCSSCSPSS
ncbi:hypothetical protein FOZ60_004652 [Perkinsus olseni]|uniref:Uncharacterized protein n=1 Tax=Perkinsus olseni TaxID=32597 RepID=A0A7J6NVA6_PEROL|nr:hypothetical protein FOZ60_004652 [Perkinsus olseni]